MRALLAWVNRFTSFIGFWLPKLWEWIKGIGVAFWGLAVAVVGLLWAVVSHIVPMITVMLNILAGITTGTFHLEAPGALSEALAVGNTFFPLEEFFGYLATYGVLIVALTVYRVVKNLIPTEAGT